MKKHHKTTFLSVENNYSGTRKTTTGTNIFLLHNFPFLFYYMHRGVGGEAKNTVGSNSCGREFWLWNHGTCNSQYFVAKLQKSSESAVHVPRIKKQAIGCAVVLVILCKEVFLLSDGNFP